MNIWIIEEFNAFVEQLQDKPASYCGFHILFWCSLRIGELPALAWEDMDLESGILHVTKSYQRIGGRDIITPPKTPKSIRDIGMPKALVEVIQAYKTQIYRPSKKERAFPYTKSLYENEMNRGAGKAKMEKIRVHDLRHSHASLLIEMNINPVAISRRLGHEKVETTLNIYGHLYPDKDKESVNLMDELNPIK